MALAACVANFILCLALDGMHFNLNHSCALLSPNGSTLLTKVLPPSDGLTLEIFRRYLTKSLMSLCRIVNASGSKRAQISTH